MKNLFFFPKLLLGEYEENYMKTMFFTGLLSARCWQQTINCYKTPTFFLITKILDLKLV